MSWALDREPETFKIYSRLYIASACCFKQAIKLMQGCPVLCLTILKRSKFAMCFDHLTLCHISHQRYFQPQKNRKCSGLDLQLHHSCRYSLCIARSSCSYVWDHPVCTFTKENQASWAEDLPHLGSMQGNGMLVLQLNCARSIFCTKPCYSQTQSFRARIPKKA